MFLQTKTNSAAVKRYRESLSLDRKAQVLVNDSAAHQKQLQSLLPENKTQIIKWPHHLNLSPNSNLIRIPIGLTSQCKKKVRVGTQESVTYYAHAVDLAFAITV